MDLNKLEIYCRVVENQSIVRTAEQMHLSQPGVSVIIRRLEKELGTKLLERHGRKVVPTYAGQTLYRFARSLIAMRDEAYQWLTDLKAGRRGQVFIGASTTGVLYYLPPLLANYRSQYPQIEVILQAAITDRIREAVVNEIMDIGFIWGPVADHRLHSRLLTIGEFAAIAPSTHPLTSMRSPLPAEALAQENFILAKAGSSTRWFAESRLREAGIIPRVIMEFETTEAMKLAVASGLGISVVSRKAVEREIADGILQILSIENINLRRPILAIWSRHRTLSPAAKTLLELATTYFGSLSSEL